jgi:hypothetical protein
MTRKRYHGTVWNLVSGWQAQAAGPMGSPSTSWVVWMTASLATVVATCGDCSPQESVPARDVAGEAVVMADEEPADWGVDFGVPATTVLLTMGEERVTLADIDLAVRRQALLQGVPVDVLAPAQELRDPHFLWRVGDRIMQERRLLREGERLGLMPDLDQLRQAWLADENLAPLWSEDLDAVDARLRAVLGLSVQDIYHALVLEWVHKAWVERVWADMSEERLRAEYLYRNRTVTCQAIEILNVPSDAEIAALVAAPPAEDWFETEYAAHPNRYTLPESRDIRLIARYQRTAFPAALRAARSLARRGGGQATWKVWRGSSLEDRRTMVGCARASQRDKEPGLSRCLGELNDILQNDGQVYFFAWASQPTRQRPLDDVLRRVAAGFLSPGTLDRATELANTALALWQADDEAGLAELVASQHLRLLVIGPIRREPDGIVAGIGVAPDLVDALFALTDESPVLGRAVLVDDRVYVLRLVERHEPTDAEINADREDFARQMHELVSATAWDAFWAQSLEETPIEWEVGDDFFRPAKQL